jgi:hypothetical protein
MKPIPGHDLYVTLTLDTLFLPDTHPPSIFYAPSPSSQLDAYQPLTPAFWAWLRQRVANASRTNPAAVASTSAIRESLQEYVTLRYTSSELAAATPAILEPPYSPSDLAALTTLTPSHPFVHTKTMTAWLPRT